MRARAGLVYWMVVLVAAVFVMPGAYAFYPLGGFTTNSGLVIPKWPISVMDTNHNGDVSGPNEGIPITFEVGSLGFTTEEMNLVKQSFDTWGSVPSSYVKFRYTDPVPNLPDPLTTVENFGSLDFYNYVALQVAGENQDLPTGLLAQTSTVLTLDATTITINGQPQDIPAGEILDSDIVFDGTTLFKTNLRGISMPAIGAMLGLAYSPMWFNLNPDTVRNAPGNYPLDVLNPDPNFVSVVPYENPGLELRDATGQLVPTGATPSMFPYMYYFSPGPVVQPTELSADYAYVAPSAKSERNLEANLNPLSKATVSAYLSKDTATATFRDFQGLNAILAAQSTPDPRLKIGVNFPINLSGASLFTGPTVDGQYNVYTAAIQSVDAQGLRIQVDLATLSPQEQLFVLDPVVSRSYGPFTRDTSAYHNFWLPAVEGDKAVLVIRSTSSQTPSLQVDQGSHFFLSLAKASKVLSCHVNIACETDPDLLKISTGIGMVMSVLPDGTYVASGSLLNNPDTPELEPYFLTANHVIGNESEAKASEVIWDYRSTSCTVDNSPDPFTLPYSLVTDVLATLQPLDGTLVKLDSVPVGVYGRAYLGWDASRWPIPNATVTSGNDPVVCISHPAGTAMRISRGTVASIDNQELVGEFGPVMGMTQVNFTSGIVEPGSSGSPLMYDDGRYRVMGMLSNGPAGQDCTASPPTAYYGSFRDFFPFIAGYLTGTNPPPVMENAGQEGHFDLAPDDIAGITYLYPRTDQNNFFDIHQEARTQNEANLPSSPISLGMITAWCDTDNDPTTTRVPLFTTLTSLYEIQPALRGRFDMPNLFKQLETNASGLFNATYTFTLSQVYYPLDFPQMTFDPKSFDSTHGGTPISGASGLPGFDVSSGYPAEVFKEGGNIFGITSYDQGTPLEYDPVRRQVISTESQRTLDSILPGTIPMFGDGGSSCPYTVLAGGLSSSKGPDALRAFRDHYLLHTSVGAAVVDLYYHAAPSVARYLLGHATAWRIGHRLAAAVEWGFAHWWWVIFLGFGLIAAGIGGMRSMQRHLGRTTLLIALLGVGLAVCRPAQAQLMYMSTDQMVAASNDIITGVVTTTDSHWNNKKQIVTDVNITVTDVIKGTANKNSNVALELLGGRVGAIAERVTFTPSFQPQQKVLVFLENRRKDAKNADAGPLVVCGTRGKFNITEDPVTKVQYISGGTPEAQLGLADVRAALAKRATRIGSGDSAKAAAPDMRIRLDDYIAYLRHIVEKQKRK